MAGELVEFRHVGADEGDAGLLQAGDEMHVAGEPIELRDNEAGAPPAAEVNGFGQLGPVVVLARLLFFERGERRDVAEIAGDGGPLGIEAERLLVGRNPVKDLWGL